MEIRHIRNASVGHPTQLDGRRGRPVSYHFLVRVSLDRSGFELHSADAAGKWEVKRVGVTQLIADQRACAADILTRVAAEMERRDAAHREGFGMEKLSAVFPESMEYHLGSVLVATGRTRPVEVDGADGLINLAQVRGACEDLRSALARRGIEIDTYQGVKYAYEEMAYPLSELKAFFEDLKDGREPKINEKVAYALAFYLAATVRELTDAVRGIDEEYAG